MLTSEIIPMQSKLQWKNMFDYKNVNQLKNNLQKFIEIPEVIVAFSGSNYKALLND